MNSVADVKSSAPTHERLVAARHLLDSVHAQIRAADEKVRVLFSGTALLAAALAFTNPSGGALLGPGPVSVLIAALHILLLASVAVAVVSAILALLPRVSLGQPDRSLYFFSDIAAVSHTDFIEEFGATSEAALLRQALSQVYVNATIVRIKHVWIRRAAVAFAVSVLFLVFRHGLMLFQI
jgi:hypothetical protein